jgi:cysteinyl-tRNA synthetase
MGVTDVDDKIIAKSKSEGLKGKEGAASIARTYEHGFFKDMAKLNVLPPDAVTRVTDFLPDIIDFIRQLQAKGFAYKGGESGTMWFDVKAYGPRYGALEPSRGFACGHDHEEAGGDWEGEGNVKATVGEKRNVRDFALWKPVRTSLEARTSKARTTAG